MKPMAIEHMEWAYEPKVMKSVSSRPCYRTEVPTNAHSPITMTCSLADERVENHLNDQEPPAVIYRPAALREPPEASASTSRAGSWPTSVCSWRAKT